MYCNSIVLRMGDTERNKGMMIAIGMVGGEGGGSYNTQYYCNILQYP